jgi:hypothetical protein
MNDSSENESHYGEDETERLAMLGIPVNRKARTSDRRLIQR